eukprot:g15621.t1
MGGGAALTREERRQRFLSARRRSEVCSLAKGGVSRSQVSPPLGTFGPHRKIDSRGPQLTLSRTAQRHTAHRYSLPPSHQGTAQARVITDHSERQEAGGDTHYGKRFIPPSPAANHSRRPPVETQREPASWSRQEAGKALVRSETGF